MCGPCFLQKCRSHFENMHIVAKQEFNQFRTLAAGVDGGYTRKDAEKMCVVHLQGYRKEDPLNKALRWPKLKLN